MRKKKVLLIAAVIVALLVSLGAAAWYLTSQSLFGPSTVELKGAIYGGLGVKPDPINCLLAGRPTGWKGHREYLGFISANQQKMDVVAQDGILAVGSDTLKNCQSVTELVTDGQTYQELVILNRFNQIWYKIGPYK